MSDTPIHEVLAEIGAKVPAEEWAKLGKTHYADPDTIATLTRLERENADLRAKLEDREKHIGILVSCLRAACASPFNLVNQPHWQAAIDAAIAQGKGEK